MISSQVPDINLFTPTQTFPRYVYRTDEATGALIREDNITSFALDQFRNICKDASITPDDIFDYVYGLLHAPDYRKRFATDLRLGLPRIPMADDFWAFANAGAALARLHLNWPLDGDGDGDPGARTDLGILFNNAPAFPDMIPEEAWRVKKMKWEARTEGRFIRYNPHLCIGPIPEAAMGYTIGNRTPLDWVIDRYQIKTNKDSGITNDPNDWIACQGRPDALIELIRRVTYLSVETARIIKGLPKAVG